MSIQGDIVALVILDDMRLDILAAHIGSSIYVRYKTDCRVALATLRCRDCTHCVAIFVGCYVDEP